MIDHRVLVFWVLPAFVLGVVAGMALALWLFVRPFSTRSFHGDGVISDNGCLSFPRFRIAFEPVSLSSETERTWRFSSVPTDTFTFHLELARNDALALDLDSTHLACTLTNVESGTTHAAAGPLRDWVLAESALWCAFWHPALRDLKLSRRRSYALEVLVRAPHDRPSRSPIPALPVLEGGGCETP